MAEVMYDEQSGATLTMSKILQISPKFSENPAFHIPHAIPDAY